MSATTKIEWTDRTWNPVRGCSRVSPGCERCYAMGQAHRFSGVGKPYEGLTTIRRGKVDWSGVARFIPKELGAPLRWRKPQRIFVNSMSDLFHSSLTNEEIAAVFGVMAVARRHTFQVLTKRPERARDWFQWLESHALARHRSVDVAVQEQAYLLLRDRFPLHPVKGTFKAFPWPLTNLWLGVSIENQETADKRISLLLQTPAAVRFVSYEPALGPVTFADGWLGASTRCPDCGLGVRVDEDGCCRTCGADAVRYGLDWVIIGGESGPGARPCALEWIERVVGQCRAAQVPCFVKQLGSYVVSEQRACDTDEEALRDFGFGSRWLWRAGTQDRKGGDPSEWPPELRVREFPEVRT
jgi:protein gp37